MNSPVTGTTQVTEPTSGEVRDTRTRLLETALDLIWHSSYEAVGINEICKQAGVTKGGFYHHFDSKATLFCEATTHYWSAVRKELDTILSPANTPLEQLENMINFIFSRKFGNDADNIPGCPYFSAGGQTGCQESAVVESLRTMSNNGQTYSMALVRNLQSGEYLEGEVNVPRLARLLSQFISGAVAYARLHHDLDTVKQDLPEGLYRLIGLKREYWYSTQATWSATSCCLKACPAES